MTTFLKPLPILAVLLAALALSACGNKGPLVLPSPDASDEVLDDGSDADAAAEPTDDAASEDAEPRAEADPAATDG